MHWPLRIASTTRCSHPSNWTRDHLALSDRDATAFPGPLPPGEHAHKMQPTPLVLKNVAERCICGYRLGTTQQQIPDPYTAIRSAIGDRISPSCSMSLSISGQPGGCSPDSRCLPPASASLHQTTRKAGPLTKTTGQACSAIAVSVTCCFMDGAAHCKVMACRLHCSRARPFTSDSRPVTLSNAPGVCHVLLHTKQDNPCSPVAPAPLHRLLSQPAAHSSQL